MYKGLDCHNAMDLFDRDSLQQGWKILMVLTAYFDCSENLRPYLFKYVEETAYDHNRPCHSESPLVSSAPYHIFRLYLL